MSGGGIIIQRAKVLLVAITDPCMFDGLHQHDKDRVNAIDAKPELDRTQEDVSYLASLVPFAVHC